VAIVAGPPETGTPPALTKSPPAPLRETTTGLSFPEVPVTVSVPLARAAVIVPPSAPCASAEPAASHIPRARAPAPTRARFIAGC
jgi:hypothetical protein